MKITSVIERAAKLLWQHRMLAALGVLDIILTASGLLERIIMGFVFQIIGQLDTSWPFPVEKPLVSIGQLGELYRVVSGYGTAGWIGVYGGLVLVLIALAVIGIVIDGGIIAAARDASQGKPISVGGVLAAGWRRALPMVVIASVPAIPPTIGATLVVIIATVLIQAQGGLETLTASTAVADQTFAWISVIGGLVMTLATLIALPLALLTVLAYQACMLEDLNTVPAFRRAWEVLRGNAIPVLLLVALGYLLSLIASTVGYVPGFLSSLCLPAIVLTWLINGTARTFYLTMWSLGWVEMTGAENQETVA